MLFQKQVRVGELIRNKRTREMWLVVQKSTQGVFIINLMLHNNSPAPVAIITPGTADEWSRDTEIDDLESWEAKDIMSKMDVIEEMEEEFADEAPLTIPINLREDNL